MQEQKNWQTSLRTCLEALRKAAPLDQRHLLVVGASTSEVVGKKIGTTGSADAAAALFEELQVFSKETGVSLAFQGCEHINRALVIDRKTAEKKGLAEVSVIPHGKAGGAMVTHAYHHLEDPVIVEHVQADAGIDIGDTFIGMHLKHVAVPVRCEVTSIGEAHVTMARTRPKLIGGERATYS
ncbi:TIGR01440 family protein [Alteribacillus sp. HJP-4]|uniref:TIGR01440 family protein n=1 Tax=Alteribacillus sp. HJP-4 TaxID=2775394 RepID=UPI0035CD04DF